jgi:hypothetical protein
LRDRPQSLDVRESLAPSHAMIKRINHMR